MNNEAERKTELEKRFNVELQPSKMPGIYRLHVDGVQKVFTGISPGLKLIQIEELIPWLDENHKGWRE